MPSDPPTSIPVITVLIVATRGYVRLAERLITQLRDRSVEEVQYIVLTDRSGGETALYEQVIVPDYDWPELALRRYEMLLTAIPRVRAARCVMLDADTSLLPGHPVPWPLLTDCTKPLVAVQHWDSRAISGNQYPPYCYDKRSAAYVTTTEAENFDGAYVQGAALGGDTVEFTKLLHYLNVRIEVDRTNNVEAVWHDESHWNKYVLHHRARVHIIPHAVWKSRFHISNKEHFTADQLRSRSFNP